MLHSLLYNKTESALDFNSSFLKCLNNNGELRPQIQLSHNSWFSCCLTNWLNSLFPSLRKYGNHATKICLRTLKKQLLDTVWKIYPSSMISTEIRKIYNLRPRGNLMELFITWFHLCSLTTRVLQGLKKI